MRLWLCHVFDLGSTFRISAGERVKRRKLAEIAGVSPRYFARLFRNRFRVPPHRYLLERRLANARDHLRGKRHSIAEIAAMTGFSDQSQLARLFKRRLDVTRQGLTGYA
jgi:AraC family transcriptional regulator